MDFRWVSALFHPAAFLPLDVAVPTGREFYFTHLTPGNHEHLLLNGDTREHRLSASRLKKKKDLVLFLRGCLFLYTSWLKPNSAISTYNEQLAN